MITIVLVSARPEPKFQWFFDSLLHNDRKHVSQIVIVDKYAEACDGWTERDVAATRNSIYDMAGILSGKVQHVAPKPCVWSGKHRLTPRNWWSTASYRNTGLCYARGQFIAYLDDRCVLEPTWMDAVNEAFRNQYVVCGTFEKVHNLCVSEGKITSYVEPKDGNGKPTGKDPRMDGVTEPHRRRKCHGDWVFGCTFALPTEWMLQVNGVDESWDSVSMEDTHFGKMLENNGYPIFHDGRMRMVEDRTPREQDPMSREHDMKRSSKERHPHDKEDKTHQLIKRLWDNKKAHHAWNFRVIRDRILAGHAFPVPIGPKEDWFDGQPLSEMT